MVLVAEGTPNPAGERMLEELLWVHGHIRSNMHTIDALIASINAGAPAEQVQAEIDHLARTSAVWTLRMHCMRYCQFVHHHHRLEDAAIFPGLRRLAPALSPVIDQLEADHRLIGGHLDAVEAATRQLRADDGARAPLTAALRSLNDLLLAHLDYEERNLRPTLLRLTGWPQG